MDGSSGLLSSHPRENDNDKIDFAAHEVDCTYKNNLVTLLLSKRCIENAPIPLLGQLTTLPSA